MTYTALQTLTADELNTSFGAVTALSAGKTVDETVNNTATLQNDDELFVTPAISTIYLVEATILYESGTTPDIKFSFTWPTGATFPWSIQAYDTALAFRSVAFTAPTSGVDFFTVGGSGLGSLLVAKLYGMLTMGTTAGNLRLQWAQATANASNTIVRAGSTLTLTPTS